MREEKMSGDRRSKIKVREVNRHLVCRLCRGYYVDATTIAECLHSFCRSCIIKYLEKNGFCPICEVQINTTKPYLSLRQDKALQDVVYKLVPGLYHNEMQRRRQFYSGHPEQITATTPEQCGIEDRIIFSPDEIISLSLEKLDREEYVFESISSQSSQPGTDGRDKGSIVPQQLVLKKSKHSRRKGTNDQEVPTRPKRYLRCPAAVAVSHLKKFIRMKYDLGERSKVDIIHKRVSLPDHYTLMDVAYIYTWKRNGPMRLFYFYGEPKMEDSRPPEPALEFTLPVAQPETKAKDRDEKIFEKKNEVAKVPESSEPPLAEQETNTKIEICEKAVGSAVVTADECNVLVKENKTNGESSECESVISANGAVEKQTNAIETEPKPEIARPRPRLANGEVESSPETNVKNDNTDPVPLKTEERSSTEKKDKVAEVAENIPKKEEKLKKTIASLLKNYRKDNPVPEGKVAAAATVAAAEAVVVVAAATTTTTTTTTTQNGEGDASAETAANLPKKEKSSDKKEADVTIEIASEAKASEYDFESNSPPGKIIPLREFTKSEQSKNRKPPHENGRMSLQEFRKVMNNGEPESNNVLSKIRLVPSLKRIDENRKSPIHKSNGKIEEKRKSPTVINIQTEDGDYKKKENRVEASWKISKDSPPPPITIENKGGEYSIKHLDENKKPDSSKNGSKRSTHSPESIRPPSPKRPRKEEVKSDSCGAMDLSKSDPGANPTECAKKNDENMVEALISAAQKQNIEPLLRVPQFLKNSSNSPPKISPGRNISRSDISQALQFYKDLRSDIRVLEAKSQLSSHPEHFAPKLTSYQLYHHQMELMKKLKKQQQQQQQQHQAAASEYQPPAKVAKCSPPAEKQRDKGKSSLSPGSEEALAEEREIDLLARMKHLKNLPALLEFYARPPFVYYSGASSAKANQNKMQSPSLSPCTHKSPKTPPGGLSLPMTAAGASFFNGQSYTPTVNTGLTSEMTFHQMFQNYLNQQEKMNQMKSPGSGSGGAGRTGQNSPGGSVNSVADGLNETKRSPPKSQQHHHRQQQQQQQQQKT